ncbi:type VI secretion system Vgr family protein [Piscinibacter sp. HJYY11]|uniref:type VI secretion system Vgr family protein n=1 Tax=Piscinibacter sp. HJYY11 TaxID=2801333 RepID=UPI00191D5191|nr:type VI secretion system tip protein TssI/VgrG [Piscinibacter sp. HJYY11]MBL0726385.1 type VI secretion system tip protein VgrG [Piscinibacter sp. HJYY11]
MPSPITLTSPLPASDLMFDSMTANGGLSTLEEMQVTLLSPRHDIKPADLLGKTVTVSVALADGKRPFHGYVTRFSMGSHQGRYYQYRATVRPWLWFLTRTSDCRIFQEMSVPDIVKKIFEDHRVANYKFNLFRSYRKWNYCVQYRESDFNFISRLLEHEGIYWYFEHKDNEHKLVLVDSRSAHDAKKGHETLPFYELGSAPPDTESISHWSFSREIRPGKTVLDSYDFERPSVDLVVDKGQPQEHDLADSEVFDYQGDYIQAADGKQLAEDRLDEQHSRFHVVQGASNGHSIHVGSLLKMTKHPRDDQNAEYLVVATSIQASVRSNESGAGGNNTFHCDFHAIPSSQQFRPQRRTPKPFVQGPQTAVVVGPGGEEIYTDKYGRVKVQFHWDREAKKKDLKDRSSCWVRVSYPWAGKNFGAIHIPRIGQEVVVGFLEGDPDQPLITGRVYNAEQMPPWDLPANATQSGILTRSSKGGAYANANAIRFEDKKGSEQLWIHAEKNQDIEVENDETHWVGHDRTKTIDHDETVHVKHDRTETVDNNETITIGVDRTESVGSNETIDIGSNRTETVGVNEDITIGANRTESVGADETITIGSNRSVTVGASKTETVALQRTRAVGVNESVAIGAAQEIAIGAAQTVTVGAAQSISVGANQSTTVGAKQDNSIGSDRKLTVGGSQTTSIGKGRKTSVADDDALSVGKNLRITAADSITLTTGSASITMKKDGTITIKGKDITIEGSGKINAKASSDIVMKGSKILQN